MKSFWSSFVNFGILIFQLTLAIMCVGGSATAQTESIPPDSPRWQLDGKAEAVDYLGRRCLRLDGGSATVRDFEIADGVIDLDMAGTGTRGFYNIFFRTRLSGDGERVYLRPHKSGLDDAQQYTPTFSGAGAWQIYNGPGFTAAVDIPKDVWFHVRLVIAGAQAKLYVSNMDVPSLMMNDLKSGIRKGSVGLIEGTFYVSNFEIRTTPPIKWERHEPAMAAATITHWALSPSLDALRRDLERPLTKSEREEMKWQEVTAEPPGFVVISRYRKAPEIVPTWFKDFSKRLEPQEGTKVVYARATIVSDRDQVKKLNIGYSDEVSVFLNDQILYRGRSAQRFRDPGFLGILNAENDAVFLPLKKGQNELILAVSELTGGWGFICRFDNMAGIR